MAITNFKYKALPRKDGPPRKTPTIPLTFIGTKPMLLPPGIDHGDSLSSRQDMPSHTFLLKLVQETGQSKSAICYKEADLLNTKRVNHQL